MKLPHFTQHGSRTTGDALDLFGDETTLLEDLCNAWKATTPDRSMGDKVVPAKWDHGTIGKLLLEHIAVRLAASEDVVRVLSEEGREAVASLLAHENKAVRPLLDQMYDSARGVQPISIAITPSFVEPADAVLDLVSPGLGEAQRRQTTAILTTALGSERHRLRSAKFIRKHAPAHPGPPGRWYDRIPVLLRVRAAEDRLRGFPWGESRLGDRKLARRYDHEG
jgi:hypothetical protein